MCTETATPRDDGNDTKKISKNNLHNSPFHVSYFDTFFLSLSNNKDRLLRILRSFNANLEIPITEL